MGIPNRPQAFRGGLPLAMPLGAPIPFAPAAPLPATSGADATAPFSNRYAAQDLGAPVETWGRVRSTWVWAMLYDPYPQTDERPSRYGDLQVEMVDGAILLWQNVDRGTYLNWWQAPRKGVWLGHWDRRSDYTTVRATQYRGAALAARVQANA